VGEDEQPKMWKVKKSHKQRFLFRFVSSRPRFVLAITLSLILLTATIADTLQYQKAYAQGGLIDNIKKFVTSIIEKCTRTVSTSSGTACNGNGVAAVQEGGGAGGGCGGAIGGCGGGIGGGGTGGGIGGGSGGGSGPIRTFN
jgi:hypothetical protein